MKKYWIILSIILVLGLAACNSAEEATPTPFATAVPLSPSSNSRPIPVPITDLAANPAFYEGVLLELTGQYRRRPLLVCGADPHLSPATWGLVADSFMAQAGGFDAELRALIPDGLTITVAGRWRQWQGPVGCGKKAVASDIWFLEVNRIVSPSPLTAITLTPSGAEGETAVAEVTPDETPVPEQGAPTAPPESTGEAATPTATGVIFSLTATPTPTGVTPVGGTPPSSTPTTASGEPTATAVPGTPTITPANSPTASPTPTFTPGATATVTATPTPGPSPTPANDTPTPTPINFTVVDMGEADPDEPVTEHLEANEIHSWTFSISASTTITVSVATETNYDAVLSILDPGDTVIVEQDIAGAGQVETIGGLSLSTMGTYEIYIHTKTGAVSDYVIKFTDDLLSFPSVLHSAMSYGETQSGTLAEETDHYWPFYGNAGDIITITAVPDGLEDLFLGLYMPNGQYTQEHSADSGQQEQIANFTLSNTGLHTIVVGEWDFNPGSYQITLTKN